MGGPKRVLRRSEEGFKKVLREVLRVSWDLKRVLRGLKAFQGVLRESWAGLEGGFQGVSRGCPRGLQGVRLSTRFLEVFIFSLFSFRFSFHIVCMGMRIGNWVQGLGVVITQYWVFFPHLHAYHALAHLLKGISWSSSSSIIHIAPDSQSRPTPKIAEEQESTPKGYPPPYPSSSSTPQGS